MRQSTCFQTGPDTWQIGPVRPVNQAGLDMLKAEGAEEAGLNRASGSATSLPARQLPQCGGISKAMGGRVGGDEGGQKGKQLRQSPGAATCSPGESKDLPVCPCHGEPGHRGDLEKLEWAKAVTAGLGPGEKDG